MISSGLRKRVMSCGQAVARFTVLNRKTRAIFGYYPTVAAAEAGTHMVELKYNK